MRKIIWKNADWKNQHSANHKITISVALQVSQSQSLGRAQTEQLETAIRDRSGRRRRGGFGSLLPSSSRLCRSPLLFSEGGSRCVSARPPLLHIITG